MYTFMVVSLFLGYVLILIFGLLHVAQELVTRTSPLLVSYSDLEADRDDELLGATQSPSAERIANEGPHKRERP